MKTRISKAYRGEKHVGWKKTVGGISKMLVYGIGPADEAKAQKMALALEARWLLVQLEGRKELTDEDFQTAKELAEGKRLQAAVLQPASNSTLGSEVALIGEAILSPGSTHMLYAAIDEYIATVMKSLKADASNGDGVFNACDRIRRAREAIVDVPLTQLRRKELDAWLQAIAAMKSKVDDEAPLGPTTIRNYTSAVRDALSKFAAWEWWQPPTLWNEAFKPYTIKKLQSPADRKRKKKRPVHHSISELRVLWHMAVPLEKALIALAVWAGHTQKEIATLALDEVVEEDGGLYIDRDRHKTGVPGRWWIPPEAAAVVRQVIARTPRDKSINPDGLAFLANRRPLVYRSVENPRSKTDTVGKSIWPSLLRAASRYGVRNISFKHSRKGTSQSIRDGWGKEVSRMFLAQTDEDVQDEHYTRPLLEKCERAVRELYPTMRGMFEPIVAADWDVVREAIDAEITAMSKRR